MVQVIPALTNTPGGTCVMRTVPGMRCASRTQVKVGRGFYSSLQRIYTLGRRLHHHRCPTVKTTLL
jgi:hypothetical protein